MSSALSGVGDWAGVFNSDDSTVDVEKVDEVLRELDWLRSEAIDEREDVDDMREIV